MTTPTPTELTTLIAEARALEPDYGDNEWVAISLANRLADALESLSATTPTTREWGYMHADQREGAQAITPDGRHHNWFSTRDEAQRAMDNDLRWRPDTFLVSREVTAWVADKATP